MREGGRESDMGREVDTISSLVSTENTRYLKEFWKVRKSEGKIEGRVK